MSRIEKLERELNLKQLQINSLLTITQAINANVSAEDLFSMYRSFLQLEISIRKMALFFREDEGWECKTSIGVQESLLQMDISNELSRFRSRQGVSDTGNPLLDEFDLVIPVLHKDAPIAYALIGGFDDSDDIFNKVQIITTITNVISVAIENKRLFKQQMRQEIINREVELAAEIQRTLVPSSLPSGHHFQLSSIYKPHFAVGGDYYDVVEFPDGKIAFCIADITGKGVPAALLMANFQANFRASVMRRTDLEDVVKDMNQAVHSVTQGDRFITLFLAKYDTEARSLQYVNAGHTPPILIMGDQVIRLKNGSTILGFFPDLPFLETGDVAVGADALIFSYTDGLTDLRNDAEEEFSDEKLIDFLQSHAHMTAKEINTHLLNHIERFRGAQPYPDDITVLSCKVFH